MVNVQEKSLVHKHENVLYVFCILASISIVFWLLFSIIGALIIIGLGLLTWFSHAISMAHIQVNGVKLRENQFPELYQKVELLCERMEMNKVPEVYIIESGGMLNAFATKVFGLFGKNIVVLYSDFVDLAEDFHEDEVEFVLAHELAHIKNNHVIKSLLIFPAMWVPFLGVSYSRMAEYTCDRMAAYYTGKPHSAINALLVFAAGKRLFMRVELSEYLQQYNDKKGIWVTLMELLSTHPPLPKRIHSIETMMEKGPTLTLVNRTKQVLLLALILGVVIPGIFTAMVIVGVQAVEKIGLLEEMLEIPDLDYTPLMDASMNGETATVKEILEEGNDPNEQNEYGENALDMAVMNEYQEIVELLLAYGADPNMQDDYGWTPLMSAVMSENLELGQMLLDAGADLTLVDEYEMTALDHAREGGMDEYIELLEGYSE